MPALILFFILAILVMIYVGPLLYMACVNWLDKKHKNSLESQN